MKALLVYPEFSSMGFWNYREVCALMGRKYPASPLGLITLAALLPSDWEVRLRDLNVTTLPDSDIEWADLVFIGGMLPQQAEFLRLIDRVHALGKPVVAGGPDPTSQPDLYSKADHLVLGEAETTLPAFLRDLEAGAAAARYVPDERPDIAESPVPRFDLLDLDSYLMVGIQFSRGCPFQCEFCDIIELYGRRPRTKTPEQVVRELDALHALGYRGHVDFVDDNFIGHRAQAKAILRAVREWSVRHGHPFFFSTEASINLADDEELLDLMRELDFRYVFVGIESPDEEVLAGAHKSQNLRRDIVENIEKIHRHGIVVNGGFILGFDNESPRSADAMVDLIERGNIVMAMVGLLFALPTTQLERRLRKEGRLFGEGSALSGDAAASEVDQATSGLNFVTLRPRREVLADFRRVLGGTYSTRRYFDRCLRASRALRVRPRYRPSWSRRLEYAKAFAKVAVKLGLRPSTAYLFWRNLLLTLVTRTSSAETLVNLMAMYLHFGEQSRFIESLLTERIDALEKEERDEERQAASQASAGDSAQPADTADTADAKPASAR